MNVRVGKTTFHDWASLELLGGWTDTFIFRLSPTDGLPPADYAGVVRAVGGPLRKLRPGASLWVQIGGRSPLEAKDMDSRPSPNGTGSRAKWATAGMAMEGASWFRDEVRYALRGLPLPVAVTANGSLPQIWDFSFFPRVDPRPYPRPPATAPYIKEEAYTPSELACLRVLARADCAYTAEVASLANLSKTGARAALRRLAERRLVGLRDWDKYPLWQLRRPGLSVALRSWGLPPGQRFRLRRERGRDACTERAAERPARRGLAGEKKRVTLAGQKRVSFWSQDQSGAAPGRGRASAGRHRRTARLWPAWLRKAWPQAEVWAGWSEVACGRTRPDALGWGHLAGCETLFWLEVESGNLSRERLRRKTLQRINQALMYARRSSVRMVFTVLGPGWVRRELRRGLHGLPGDLAFVMADWKAFGALPRPEFGWVTQAV